MGGVVCHLWLSFIVQFLAYSLTYSSPAAQALRGCIGLDAYYASTNDVMPKSLLARPTMYPAKSFMEAETRRNVFWLAYIVERTQIAEWPASIDDNDVFRKLMVTWNAKSLYTHTWLKCRVFTWEVGRLWGATWHWTRTTKNDHSQSFHRPSSWNDRQFYNVRQG